MLRSFAIALVSLALVAGATLAEDLDAIAFLRPPARSKADDKAAKKAGEEPADAGPDALWILLEAHQVRALTRKEHVQKKQMRRDASREAQEFPIELSETQKLAIAKALGLKKPITERVILNVDVEDVHKSKSGRRVNHYILRDPTDLNRAAS